MPKRMTRTAAQIAASRRNLQKAREARARYRGKSIPLYHRTSASNAASILKSQKFDSTKGKVAGGFEPVKGLTFFSIDPRTNARYGSEVLKVSVPVNIAGRRVVKNDPNYGGFLGYRMVRNSDLAGRKIRRHK